MYRLVAYLKFLITSKNQHGIHSPFVYNYVTKCLYAKRNRADPKLDHILLSSIDYFDVKNIKIPSHKELLLKKVRAECAPVNMDKKPYDLILMDASDPDQNLMDMNIHNHTLVIADAIYKNKANNLRWKKIKELDGVTVSIDMYHCGAVFFRKEQVAEHFKIRI